jgi:lipopolysaccharide export LptBFGC system permease protein LptF
MTLDQVLLVFGVPIVFIVVGYWLYRRTEE